MKNPITAVRQTLAEASTVHYDDGYWLCFKCHAQEIGLANTEATREHAHDHNRIRHGGALTLIHDPR